VISRGDLTDDEWALLKPLLPVSNNRCGRWRDHRQVINGIIQQDGGGPDVFAHYSNISGNGYRELTEGETVSFDIGQGTKGPQAENIIRG
jgi:CspA family cold shock protein